MPFDNFSCELVQKAVLLLRHLRSVLRKLDLFGSFDSDRRKSCLSKISPSATPNKKEPIHQSQKHMKPKTIQSLLVAALLAPGALYAQTSSTTTPVGYVTENLVANSDTMIGVTVHNPTISAGTITAEASDKVTVSGADFTTLLTPLATYILELEDGTIQEITSWTATELFTPQDITALVVPNTTKYSLRKASTIKDIFGATNQVGLAFSEDGSTASADTILLPNGLGGFNTVFYYNDGFDEFWVNNDLEDVGDTAVIYTDGMIVRRKPGTDLDLVISGEVKVKPTNFVVAPGLNIVGSVYPVGVTLANTSFSTQVIASEDGSTATSDTIEIPNGSGGYNTFFYYDDTFDALWANPDLEDKGTEPLTSGYIFRSKSVGAKPLTQTTPF
jgi:hypothetical protein